MLPASNLFAGISLGIIFCLGLAAFCCQSVAPLLSYRQLEVEEGISEQGVIRADGSIWVGDKCLINEKGNVEARSSDILASSFLTNAGPRLFYH